GTDPLRQVHRHRRVRLIRPTASAHIRDSPERRQFMNAPVKEQAAEKAPQTFPKPEFTGAEAGMQTFPSSTSRSYNYFKPQKMRATVYEDVTIDVQPDPDRHLSQGWLYGFATSPGGYPHEWTSLK